MAETLSVDGPGVISWVERELPPAEPGQFRVETVYSGISAGTELTFVKGTNPFQLGSWDPVQGLFRAGEPATPYPVRGFGYMQVGRVVESATDAVKEGALVAMTYGHRTEHLASAADERFVELPDDLDPLLGIYVAHMGPICANGLLHAAHDLYGPDVRELGDGVRGRRVAVTGAGVVGLLVALFAVQQGAAEVVVVDETAERLAVARALGLSTMTVTEEELVALKLRWRHTKDDRGADVVFQCRGQARALALALKLLRPQGTVIDLAFYPGGADEVRLGEEFHHNGLAVRCAQIGRVPRGLAHSWDRERLSAETLELLRSRGEELRRHVVTDVLGFGQAPEFLLDLAARRRHTVQAVLSRDVEDEGR
ncbi:zinc-binding alcohol dehydrogenase [Nonomuraea sp. NPDC050310]|uniref:zinc-dependent alcohol dehydrogenase n=1 Tax=unclassified Nonomuraea TaxID=2593643 RepID=UPI0033E7CA69